MANPSLQIGNSNWAIKKDNLLGYSTAGTRFLPIPITMTRASAGTRVNSSGLVENVELLGSELVTNGDFSNGLNNWTVEGATSYASIVNGALNSNNTNAGNWYAEHIEQDISFVNGTTYKVTFKAKNISGNLNLRITQNATVIISENLTDSFVDYSVLYTANLTGGSIRLFCNSAVGEFQIDDISVKEYQANDLARVDYTGSTSSLLAEPQRTNLITYSEDFSNAYWTKAGISVISDSSTSPSGAINSDEIVENSAASTQHRLNNTVTISSGLDYSITCFVKRGVGSRNFSITSVLSGIRIYFDLTNGTVGTETVGTGEIESLGNGWFKCVGKGVSISTSTVTYLQMTDGTTTGSETYSGDGVSSLYVWGGQLEQGSYATSYIPTSGSTVTRVQDQYSKTGISDKINSEEGTLFVEMAALANDSTNRMLSLYGSGNDKLTLFYKTASNSMTVQGFVGGGLQINRTIVLTDITQFSKIAIRYKTNDFAWFVDGNKITDDTSTNTWSANTLNKLSFDDGSSGNPLFAKVKQLQVFKTALTDSELATLTTI